LDAAAAPVAVRSVRSGTVTAAAAHATAAMPQHQPQPRPARRPPLRIVAPPDPDARARRRRTLVAGALASLACAGLFAIVGVRVLLAQGQAPVDALESQVTAAQAENQRLRLDVARLESPTRIVAEAQARLGMVAPAVVVYLPPLDGSLTEPLAQAAQPASTQPAPTEQATPDPASTQPTSTEPAATEPSLPEPSLAEPAG
jgi:cell division protein FtsL